MTPRIELIYDSDCPNVEVARRQLRLALERAGRPPEWTEWDRGDPDSPAHARRFGSPTILVDGRDVAGEAPSDGADCCRVYRDAAEGLQGVPSVEAILTAVRNAGGDRASAQGSSSGLRAWLPLAPAVGVSLLPKLACPACWPAYAGLLSAIGLGFLLDTAYLLPLTVAFLIVAVAALGWRAGTRRGYGPFVTGFAAAAVVIAGKFALDSNAAMYGGISLLVAASLWNSWPKRQTSSSCDACGPTGELHQINTNASP